MWFVVPEPGLAEQSSWEALLGALGRGAEGRRSRVEELFLPCGVWQYRGAPAQGDPAWAALELSGVRKCRIIPPHPAVCRARGNQKQLKIPDFPFCLAGRDAGSTGEETDE